MYKTLLVIIPLIGFSLIIYLLMMDNVELDKIQYKDIEATNAACIESRSNNGIKFSTIKDDVIVKDYISLPFSIKCDIALLRTFNEGPVTISYYNNHYYGVTINGLELKNTEEEILKYNDKTDTVFYILVLVFIVELAVGFKFKRYVIKNKST